MTASSQYRQSVRSLAWSRRHIGQVSKVTTQLLRTKDQGGGGRHQSRRQQARRARGLRRRPEQEPRPAGRPSSGDAPGCFGGFRLNGSRRWLVIDDPPERSSRRDGPNAVDTRCISSVVAKVDVRPGQKTGVSGLSVVSLVASPTAAAANPLQRQNWLWRLERCQGRSWSWNVVAG